MTAGKKKLGSKAREIERLEGERDAIQERLQRSAADLANLRRRQGEDVARLVRQGVGGVLGTLLTLLDHIDLALESATDDGPGGDSAAALQSGLQITREEVREALRREGVSRIEVTPGETAFDHDRHEALAAVPTADADPGVVLTEERGGWLWGSSVLRATRVTVAAALPEETDQEEGAGTPESDDNGNGGDA